MGGAVFPPCYLLGPNYGGGDEDNGDLLQKTPCMYCSSQCPQPCSRPPLTHTSTGDSWTLPGKSGSVSCGVTAPFSGVLVHTRFCLCPPRACTYTSYSATHCLSSLLWSVSPFMFIFSGFWTSTVILAILMGLFSDHVDSPTNLKASLTSVFWPLPFLPSLLWPSLLYFLLHPS